MEAINGSLNHVLQYCNWIPFDRTLVISKLFDTGKALVSGCLTKAFIIIQEY